MNVPPNAHVAVIDGARFVLFRNTGQSGRVELTDAIQPTLDPTNKSQGKMRHSITTNQHSGDDLNEGAHVAAAAEWLNAAAVAGRIESLIVVADLRSLGELRRHYHVKLEDTLIGEVGKALATRPTDEIESAIQDA